MMRKTDLLVADFLLKSNYKALRHGLIQLVILLITINVLWDTPEKIQPENMGVWMAYFLLMNVVVYTNKYLLVTRLLLKGHTWYYFISFTFLILLTVFVIGVLQRISPEDNSNHSPVIIGVIAGTAVFSLFLFGMTALQLFKFRIRNQKRITELKQVSMELELANLQNQINPHFLFNMLNNANIMAGEDVEKSSFILDKLNHLLNYQVNSGAKERVKLGDDIAFISDYLELEKMRRDHFNYSISIDGNVNIEVYPLLFIPFVENAVKHNPESNSRVDILFKIKKHSLYFECKNPKARFAFSKKVGGLGLVNIKRRLELLFDNQYRLNITDNHDEYSVKLECKI